MHYFNKDIFFFMFQHQQDFPTRPVYLVEDVCTQTRNVKTTSADVDLNSTSKMENVVSDFIVFVEITENSVNNTILYVTGCY